MPNQFNSIPRGIPGKPEPLTLRVPDKDLAEFLDLLRLSKIGPATWWNQHNDGRYGLSREWLSEAKETWLSTFNWRSHEDHINSFPNFKITIKDPEAGETSPHHVIVPSLPDYGFLSGASESIEMTIERAARIMNQLMVDLGFGNGYIAQGGDLGSMLARILSVQYAQCKAFHVNMLVLNPDQTPPSSDNIAPEEAEHMKRTEVWQQTGLAYALEHGTRPATIGLAISSSPIALLAWVGEKLLEWVDPQHPLPLDSILGMVTLYWFTSTLPRGLYHAELVKNFAAGKSHPISREKPMGYSLFAYDLVLVPEAWAREIYPNLVGFWRHDEGGHFASLEQSRVFLGDIEEFVVGVRGKFYTE
ncbi:hypothetical protein BDV12DRAFT_186641 [Aspergillus spectabilis]